MCPVVLRRRTGIGPRTLLTVSASGGRRILHALAQVIIGVVDFGMDPQAAIAAPRVDASTPVATLDPRIGDSVLDALRQRGHQFTVVPDGLYPRPYASPVAIAVHGEELLGGVDVYHPAVAVGL
jgi:gamma-glutamyltranspeptidase/glutathione hydrolase